MPPLARPACDVMRLRSERASSTGVFICGSCEIEILVAQRPRVRPAARACPGCARWASASRPASSTGFGFSGSGFFFRLRRRRRRWRLRLFDDELRDALAQFFGLHAFDVSRLGSRHDQDRQQRRDDQQDAQQLLELALALFLERPRQLEAAEKWSESEAHAPAPTSTLALDHGERHLAVVGGGGGRHDALEHRERRALVTHDGDLALGEIFLRGGAQCCCRSAA